MQRGALDFAGGTVVHIASAAAALAGAVVVGKRKGYGKTNFAPHNLPMTVLGAGILWFGWFGFNAGSALAANELAGTAFMATHLAAAAGMIAWLIFERLQHGKATTLGAASGAVAGLVGITPAAGFVEPIPAILIGLAAGALCYYGLNLKTRFGFDDALDVVGIHGVGGTVGALLTGVFATTLVNEAGADGVLAAGNWGLLLEQGIGVVATIAFSFGVSFVLFKIIDAVIGLRVDDEAEEAGLDTSEHAETGYVL
jgi:Amt family ammonium transporter